LGEPNPRKRFNFNRFKWPFEKTDKFFEFVLDEKLFNIQSISEMNFRALWIDKVDSRFLKLSNIKKLRIYMEDDDLDTIKHFFNFIYQDGCKIKELDLYC